MSSPSKRMELEAVVGRMLGERLVNTADRLRAFDTQFEERFSRLEHVSTQISNTQGDVQAMMSGAESVFNELIERVNTTATHQQRHVETQSGQLAEMIRRAQEANESMSERVAGLESSIRGAHELCQDEMRHLHTYGQKHRNVIVAHSERSIRSMNELANRV